MSDSLCVGDDSKKGSDSSLMIIFRQSVSYSVYHHCSGESDSLSVYEYTWIVSDSSFVYHHSEKESHSFSVYDVTEIVSHSSFVEDNSESVRLMVRG